MAAPEEQGGLRSSSADDHEQASAGSVRRQNRHCDDAAAAEALGAVRSDIVAALERRAQLQGELAHLEAGLGEARDALAHTHAQVRTCPTASCCWCALVAFVMGACARLCSAQDPHLQTMSKITPERVSTCYHSFRCPNKRCWLEKDIYTAVHACRRARLRRPCSARATRRTRRRTCCGSAQPSCRGGALGPVRPCQASW